MFEIPPPSVVSKGNSNRSTAYADFDDNVVVQCLSSVAGIEQVSFFIFIL